MNILNYFPKNYNATSNLKIIKALSINSNNIFNHFPKISNAIQILKSYKI